VRVGDTARAGADDHVSVVTSGPLVVTGNVTGGLAALGKLTLEGSCVITGSLVIARPESGSLAGLTVKHDPAMSALRPGANGRYDPRYYYVAVGPALTGKEIGR
jgi:hypothetical protein